MVNFVPPRYTKSRIRAAGKRTSKGNATLDDSIVIESFRASHAYILNTFQANIRNHSKKYNVTVGQRLKRRNTIVDKLSREPNMPLYAMHDIAGCRIVLNNEEELHAVRESVHGARWKHKLLNQSNRYNYIDNPKTTGYRGIHDIYEYNVNSVGGVAWNGLKLEIQYRTLPQHAWATAVEVADLITSNRIKFSDASVDYLRYFQLASEIIARSAEDRYSCLSDVSDSDLKREFKSADRRLGLLNTFDNLRGTSARGLQFRRNTVLIFKFDVEEGEDSLEIRAFENVNRAVEAYDELEKEFGETADIVLVRGESEESIRDAFRNYFSDARAFVDLVRDGLKQA